MGSLTSLLATAATPVLAGLLRLLGELFAPGRRLKEMVARANNLSGLVASAPPEVSREKMLKSLQQHYDDVAAESDRLHHTRLDISTLVTMVVVGLVGGAAFFGLWVLGGVAGGVLLVVLRVLAGLLLLAVVLLILVGGLPQLMQDTREKKGNGGKGAAGEPEEDTAPEGSSVPAETDRPS